MSKIKDSIAIIGLGCRFPGGSDNPGEFWDFLKHGKNGISRIPLDRWNSDTYYHPDYTTPGKISVKWGGIIDGIDRFDAAFFNISPREAVRLDPQHRMLLEISYRALEDAGQNVNELSGKDVGVFVGISAHDYGEIVMGPNEHASISGHSITGNANSIASNRISYVFNFKGPSYSVDTACSSSLIAAHNACQSLLNGDCSLALLGGVNTLIKPEITMSFSAGGFLSPTGTCKTFDESADGYIRSEGAGVIVLKRLSKAIEDGDRIYSTIIGSSVNHDGRTDGISMPNQEAQIAVLEEAYRKAGISPEKVQYVEAHGTGTAIGDPTEATALGKVIGLKRNGNKLMIGSVKSNIGHLEPASGVAGLIKLAMSMKKKKIPQNIHFNKPNPNIDFQKYGLQVPTKLTEWPSKGEDMYAGVNSFGFGGANAHLVLKGYDNEAEKDTADQSLSGPWLFVISAKNPGALNDYISNYINFVSDNLQNDFVSISDICFTTCTRKTHHDLRLCVVVNSKQELIEQLEAFLKKETRPGMSSERVIFSFENKPKIAFFCSGQGPQWWGMASELLEQEPVFKNVVERCDKELKKYTTWSLLEELKKDEKNSRMGETGIVQPALFAIQTGLAKVWESMGVKPDGVVGHSIGEVASAYLSKMLSFEEAIKVVYHRSHVQSKASGKGKMLAVGLSKQDAAKEIAGKEDKVSVAAINGPNLVTISGDKDALEEIANDLDSRDIFHRFLVVDVPFHSHYMEPLKDELLDALKDVNPRKPEIPLYSTVTGRLAGDVRYNADYWYKNVRQSVEFADAIKNMIQDDYSLFIELSPHPILSRYVSELLSDANKKGVVAASIRRRESDLVNMLGNLGKIHSSGSIVDFKELYKKGGKFIDLPLYPFQKERYWLESEESQKHRTGQRVHPHIKSHIVSAKSDSDHIWDIVLDKRLTPYIEDHKVQGPIVFPGAGSCELAFACGKSAFRDKFCFVEDINFSKAVFLPDQGDPPQIQFNVSSDDGTFGIFSRKKETDEWTHHIYGKLRHLDESFEMENIPFEDAKKRCTERVDMDTLYEDLDSSGLMLGPSFRGIEKCRRYTGKGKYIGEALGEIIVPEKIQYGIEEYNMHPAILDTCFQTLFGSAPVKEGEKFGVCIPVYIKRLRFRKSPGIKLYSYGRLKELSEMYINGDIRIYDEKGDLCVEIDGFKCRFIEGTRGENQKDINNHIYRYEWNPEERPSQALIRNPKDYIPTPRLLTGFADNLLEEMQKTSDREVYDNDFEPQLNMLTATYIQNALLDLGFDFQPGLEFTTDELIQNLNIAKGYITELFQRTLEIITDQGTLERKGLREWKVIKKPDSIAPDNLYKELTDKKEYAPFQHDLQMVGKCGPYLAGIFTGQTDPVQLLFPDEQWDQTVAYYQESYSFKKYNKIANSAVKEMLKNLPDDQTLRVLEVGAGTGGVTGAILEIFPQNRTTYTFTDLSFLFLSKAEERFGADYGFVDYKTLDITKDLEEQGIAPHSYDLVVASDVLHATPYIKESLKGIQNLLAPNGIMLMLEVTQCPWWMDIVFGLTEGWWMFQDHDLRPSHPSISQEKWKALFYELGFQDALSITDATTPDVSAQTVFLVKNRDFEVKPKPVTLPETLKGPGDWLIFNDNKGIGNTLGSSLEALGEKCFFMHASDSYKMHDKNHFTINPKSQEDMGMVFDKIKEASQNIKGIIHLWNLDLTHVRQISIKSLEQAIATGSVSILNMFRELFKENDDNPPHLWIATANATELKDCAELALSQVPAWGLGRTLMHEYHHVTTCLIDMSREITKQETDSLFQEICTEQPQAEVAIRGKNRYLHKFVNTSREYERQRSIKTIKPEQTPFCLELNGQGIIENLVFRETIRKAPATGQVELKVSAAGFNFKDVMIATGMLNEDAPKGGYTGKTLGMECSGVVTSVGQGVENIKPGDQVIAIAPKSFAAFAVTKQELIVKKPEHISFQDAAAIPLAYLTAWYSLNYIGRMEQNEKVLIHSASGGVGFAAVQLARIQGAEIFATAGSPEKRKFLRSLGIRHVMDSRKLDFADQIMDATNGEGIDIVLNSLSGSAIYKSMSVLKKYGRFLEIGKTDIYENKSINLRPFWNNLSYSAIDIDKLLAEKPGLCQKMITGFIKLFHKNSAGSMSVEPYPLHVFDISDITDAFRLMASAKHTGKVIVSIDQNQDIKILPSNHITTLIKHNATYIVTGGFSGFGLVVTKWLAEKGARNIVVISRSGAKTDKAKAFIKLMDQKGINIFEEKADISDPDRVRQIFDKINNTMPRLRGIVHSAMVLDDAILSGMTYDRFMIPVTPKVMGAWNLHENTIDLPLDFFVNFSSISAEYGNPAQSNYAAANMFLNMLPFYRKANNLAGTTISWGALGEVGFVARSKKVNTMLDNQGWEDFSPAQAIQSLEKIILEGQTHRTAMEVNWESTVKYFPKEKASYRFGHFQKTASNRNQNNSDSLRNSILSADSDKRSAILQKRLAEVIARILGTSASKLDFDTPISSLGFDSLMANQLRSWIHDKLDVDFSMMKIMRGPNINELTAQILGEFGEINLKSDNPETQNQETQNQEKSETDKWIIRRKPNPDAKLRLFCFPYMGGGASAFYSWSQALPDHIEVCAVQFPGKEERIKEQTFENVEDLISSFINVTSGLLDKPLAFYGHSVGAGIAFKIAHYLENQKNITLKHFFAGGWIAPQLKSPFKIIQSIPEAEIRDKANRPKIYQHLRTLEISEEILLNDKLMEEMLPSIISEILLGKRYKHNQETLTCPITAIAGQKDTLFNLDQVKAWQHLTDKNFDFQTVSGGHIFLRDNKEDLIKIISERLN